MGGALNAINGSLPIFRKFKDRDSEILAYSDLMGIYGARESDVKDLDKAVQYYESADRMVDGTDQNVRLAWHWESRRSTGNRNALRRPSQKLVKLSITS